MLLRLAISPSASSLCFKNKCFFRCRSVFRLLLGLFVLFLNKLFSSTEFPHNVTHLSPVIIHPYALLHKFKDCLFLLYLMTLCQLSTLLTKMLLGVDGVALVVVVVVVVVVMVMTVIIIIIVIVITTATTVERIRRISATSIQVSLLTKFLIFLHYYVFFKLKMLALFCT